MKYNIVSRLPRIPLLRQLIILIIRFVLSSKGYHHYIFQIKFSGDSFKVYHLNIWIKDRTHSYLRRFSVPGILIAIARSFWGFATILD